MADFVLHTHGRMFMLFARNDRALRRLRKLPEMNLVHTSERLLLNSERAREVLELLTTEGYKVEGQLLL